MKRRGFITLLGGSAAASPLRRGRSSRRCRWSGSSRRIGRLRSAFFGGVSPSLKEIGYVDGQNVVIEYNWAEGRIDRLPALAADLVRRQVAVIATAAVRAALAAKAATATIPIVFSIGDDPVRLGLVASLARPGGNATGINILIAELTAKRLGLLRELVPAAARVAVLVNPANATNAESTLRDVEAAARAVGLQIQVLNASTSREIDAAFADLCARAARRTLCRPATRFSTSRGCNLPLGGAPHDPRDLSGVSMPKPAG